jgi:hypothetical protein
MDATASRDGSKIDLYGTEGNADAHSTVPMVIADSNLNLLSRLGVNESALAGVHSNLGG